MLDFIPIQVWLLLALAIMAWHPARYLWDHVAHDPARRDITLPPEDLSWRSAKSFWLNLAMVAGLASLAIFICTPYAEQFAKSKAFIPAIAGAFASGAVASVLRGLYRGEIQPMLQGLTSTYSRDEQPLRFWGTAGWNSLLAFALFYVAASDAMRSGGTDWKCNDDDTAPHALEEALEHCDSIIAEEPTDETRLAELYHDRGRIHHWLGHFDLALADYSRSIELDPDISYAHSNRGLIYQQRGQLDQALEDFNVSLALDPENDAALFARGRVLAAKGPLEEGIADFSALLKQDPDLPGALINRGLAYIELGDREAAEADFAKIEPGDAGWHVVLRGKAILARQDGENDMAIDYLTQSLEIEPDNAWTLRERADIYWEIGQLDLARDDDDRLAELVEQRPPIMVRASTP